MHSLFLLLRLQMLKTYENILPEKQCFEKLLCLVSDGNILSCINNDNDTHIVYII